MLSYTTVRFSGKRLHQARTENGMTQADLAFSIRRSNGHLRTTASDISHYERQRTPGANVLAAIAGATGRDIDFFYESGGDDELDEEAAQVTEALIERLVEKRLQRRLREMGVL